jgi:hypothetical protein
VSLGGGGSTKTGWAPLAPGMLTPCLTGERVGDWLSMLGYSPSTAVNRASRRLRCATSAGADPAPGKCLNCQADQAVSDRYPAFC